MKDYSLKIYYCDELVIDYCSSLNAVLDYISDILDASVKLDNIVNTKAFTFSITEVLK